MIGFLPLLLMQALPVRSPAPPSFETLARRAAEARDAHRLDEALVLYRGALKLKPRWEDGLWAAGSIEYDQDKYKECSADFERLVVIRPDQAFVRTMAGLCEYHLRNYDAALKSLREAQRLGFPRETELSRAARLHLALVETKLRNFEAALIGLIELTRSDQRTADIIVAAGIAGLRQSWIPPEVPETERDKVFKLGDAMAAVMEEDNTQAHQKFEIVVHDYPNDPNVHFRYGAFLTQQDPERGIQEIAKTLDLQPDHVPALLSMAAICRKRGDAHAARQYADRAVRLAPSEFATHVTLGRVLLEGEDNTGAVREFEAAVRLAPASPESHLNLASAYAKLGRKEDAAREREEFRRLRQITDPHQP